MDHARAWIHISSDINIGAARRRGSERRAQDKKRGSKQKIRTNQRFFIGKPLLLTKHPPPHPRALHSSTIMMRSSFRTLVSPTPIASRPYLPYSLTSVTRYASSFTDSLASTSTPSSSTTTLLPNQPHSAESTLPTHQQPPPPPAKPARAAPRIKASRAALTLVRLWSSVKSRVSPSDSAYNFRIV